MLKRHSLASMVVGCLVLFASAAVLAQTQPAAAPQWMLVTITKLNPGVTTEYIDLQTKEVMPAQKKGGSPGRQAWSSGVSGPPREFVYISPITSFAQFDKPTPLVAALGQEGANALNAKTAKLADPQKTMIVRTRPDLSYEPNPAAPPSALAIVSLVDVLPGRRAEFEAFLKKEVVPTMRQANVKSYVVFEIAYGDSAGGYVTAVGFDTYEAIGKGHPFQTALGAEGAIKLEAKVVGIVSRIERFISRHRPELSWTQ